MMKHKRFKTFFCATIAAFFSIYHVCATAENIDPYDIDSQHAYGENVGWFNAEPSGNGGPGVEVGATTLTGYIWAENVGWISLSCENTDSCLSGVKYGVNNDGEGNLFGYAWGENVGWINFSPTGAGVYIQTGTGEFVGTAWGENIGWISFSGEGIILFRMVTSWEPLENVCEGDFLPSDGDVDGSDLATLAEDLGLLPLSTFAAEFGRVDCLQ